LYGNIKIMASVIIANTVLFAIIGSIWAARGIDLKKWSSWLLGLYAFLCGFLVGFVRSDGLGGYQVVMNLTASLQGGTIFAAAFMFVGVTSRWNRRRAEKYIERVERGVEEQYEDLAESLFKDKSNRK
jgi:hypothetical protein